MTPAYTIFEYDMPKDSIERSEAWLIEIPCGVEKILSITNKKITCLKNLYENKISLVKIITLMPYDDFVFIDNDLNENYDSYTYFGNQIVNNKSYHIYAKVIGKREEK